MEGGGAAGVHFLYRDGRNVILYEALSGGTVRAFFPLCVHCYCTAHDPYNSDGAEPVAERRSDGLSHTLCQKPGRSAELEKTERKSLGSGEGGGETALV